MYTRVIGTTIWISTCWATIRRWQSYCCSFATRLIVMAQAAPVRDQYSLSAWSGTLANVTWSVEPRVGARVVTLFRPIKDQESSY